MEKLRVGLAELERAPLGVALAAPALRVAGQREHVGPADRLVRPAERLGHRLRHRDDQRRLGDRRGLGRHQVALVLGGGALLQQHRPGPRRRRPDVRTRPVDLLVPAAGERVHGTAGGLGGHLDVDAAAADGPAGVVVVGGDPGQQRRLLRGRGHVQCGTAGALARAVGPLLGPVVATAGDQRAHDEDQHQPDHDREDQRDGPPAARPAGLLPVRHVRPPPVTGQTATPPSRFREVLQPALGRPESARSGSP